MKLRYFMLALVLTFADTTATFAKEPRERYQRVELDEGGNIRAITASGARRRLTHSGTAWNAKLSPDGRTVGWLLTSRLDSSRGWQGSVYQVNETLVIYRGGRILRRINEVGFIREWGFWNNGNQVVIYSGPLHFQGNYLLFDLRSGKRLAVAEDPFTDDSPLWANAPDWVKSLRPQSPDSR